MAIQSATATIYSNFRCDVFALKIITSTIFENTSSATTSNFTLIGNFNKIIRLTPQIEAVTSMSSSAVYASVYAGVMSPATRINLTSQFQVNLRIPTVISIDLSKVTFPIAPNQVYTLSVSEDFFTEEFNNRMPMPAVTTLTSITTNGRPLLSAYSPFNGQSNVLNNTTVIIQANVEAVSTTLIRGAGFFRLYKNGSLKASVNVLDSTKVSINNNRISINFTGFIDSTANYYVLVDNGVVVDRDGFASQAVTSTSQISFSTALSTNIDFPDLTSLEMAAAVLTLPQSEIMIYLNAAITSTATISATLERVRLASGTSSTTATLTASGTNPTGKLASLTMSAASMTIIPTKYRIEIPLIASAATMTSTLTANTAFLNTEIFSNPVILTSSPVKNVSIALSLSSSFTVPNIVGTRVRRHSSTMNTVAGMTTIPKRTARPIFTPIQIKASLTLERTTAQVFTIDTTKSGSLTYSFNVLANVPSTFSGTISQPGTGTVFVGVNWGDGVANGDQLSDPYLYNGKLISQGIRVDYRYGGNYRTIGHTFPAHGVYKVRVEGPNIATAPYQIIRITHSGNTALTEVSNFGNSIVNPNDGSFQSCSNLVKLPTSLQTHFNSLRNSFTGCSALNDPNVSGWNTVNITNFNGVFAGCVNFNQSLNSWNVSNGTDFGYMFSSAYSFNQPLNNWNVANATNMEYMFANAREFNQNINSWNVAKVRSFKYMFSQLQLYFNLGYRLKYNQPMGSWIFFNKGADDAQGNPMFNFFFQYATAYRQDLSSWCVQNGAPQGYNTIQGGGRNDGPAPGYEQYEAWAYGIPISTLIAPTVPFGWTSNLRPKWLVAC